MTTTPVVPVGVRLPLLTPALSPTILLEICRAAGDLGYSSFWVGDHVLLPQTHASAYPHTGDHAQPFASTTPWADPFVLLTWLAAQLPEARFGTSVLILTLRRAALVAKQLATVSWLTERPFSLGVGTGWLREEYAAVGVPFEHRGSRAQRDLAEIRELLDTGERRYAVDESGDEVVFTMLPTAPAPVEFLWGGCSPAAMRLVARSCDGWLPAKQGFAALEGHLESLRLACDKAERNMAELRMVVKPGPGPDPGCEAISRSGLDRYAGMGFAEAILELPYEIRDAGHAIRVLERVQARSWG